MSSVKNHQAESGRKINRNSRTRVIVSLSVNENSDYQSLVLSVGKFWKNLSNDKIEFIPKITHVHNSHAVAECPRPNSQTFHLGPEMNDVLASQIFRILIAHTFESDFVMISDLDMVPLSLKYFSQILPSHTKQFVVARDVISHENQFPMCYLVASPKVWGEVISKANPVQEFLTISKSAKFGKVLSSRGSLGWTFDQRYVFDKLITWSANGGDLLRLTDFDTRHRRLDRVIWPKMLIPILALNQGYTDYHRKIPLSNFDMFINLFLHFRIKYLNHGRK